MKLNDQKNNLTQNCFFVDRQIDRQIDRFVYKWPFWHWAYSIKMI